MGLSSTHCSQIDYIARYDCCPNTLCRDCVIYTICYGKLPENYRGLRSSWAKRIKNDDYDMSFILFDML